MVDVEVPPEFASTVLRAAEEDLEALRQDVSTLLARGTSDATLVLKMVNVRWPPEFAKWYVANARKCHPERMVLVVLSETSRVAEKEVARQAFFHLERTKVFQRERNAAFIWIGVGVLASVMSRLAAEDAGRSRYSIFWGACAYGLWKWHKAYQNLHR